MSDTSELIGRVFDNRYQITELIGRGGMGVVYKALHIAMNQVVALKVLGGQLAEDEKSIQRFYQEAKASSRLKHPNTIKVFDFGRSEEGHLYLAMEFLDGCTLTQELRRERVLSVRRALHIARQVAKSLGEAHQQGLVHRDLKPDNIFLNKVYGEEDYVKVLDFGIAKFLEGNPDHENLTQAGLVCGTPLYISPEQALGKSLDGRSDLYSLGVILYEMVSGRTPFKADTPIALVMRHIHDRPPPMTDHNPGLELPYALSDLIYRLLDKDRDKRPATAEDFLHELEAIVAAGGFPDVPSKELVDVDAAGRGSAKTRVENPLSMGMGEVEHEGSTQFLQEGGDVDPDASTAFMSRETARPVTGQQPRAVTGQQRVTGQQPRPVTGQTPRPPTGQHARVPTGQTQRPTVRQPPVPGAPVRVPAAEPAGKSSAAMWLVLGVVAVAALVGGGGYLMGWFGSSADSRSQLGGKVELVVKQEGAKAAEAPAREEPAQPKASKSQAILLETAPAGALASMGGKDLGKTPVKVTIAEGDSPATVVFKAEGFRDLSVTLNPGDILAAGKTSFRYELEKAAVKVAAPEPPKGGGGGGGGSAPKGGGGGAPKGGGGKGGGGKKPKLNWDE